MKTGKPSARTTRRPSIPKLFGSEDEPENGTDTNIGGTPDRPAPLQYATVLAGGDRGRVITLGDEDIWVGRAADCQVVLRDRGVSRRHLVLSRRGSALVVRDNRAKNGTFRNQRRVSGEEEIQPGDVIGVGTNARLLFTTDLDADALRPPRVVSAASLGLGVTEAPRPQRLDSVVAGLAHEINTPLGVARTAIELIASLTETLQRAERGADLEEVFADLKASTGLLSKNLERASELVRRLIPLSLDTPTEERITCDLGGWVRECMRGHARLLAAHRVEARLHWREDDVFPWCGYAQPLADALGALVENVCLHAYEGSGGPLEIGLEARGDDYMLTVGDRGVGLTPDVQKRLFQPFVTTCRDRGAAGLGLATARHVFAKLLRGSLSCKTVEDRGTTFVALFPRVVP